LFNTIVVLFSLGFVYLYLGVFTPAKAPLEPIILPKFEIQKVTDTSAVEETPKETKVAGPIVYEANPVDMEKGKEIYLSTCIKCHNKDPNIKGAIGPELVDAPLEVMQHKVATGRYPEVLPAGFVPKRKTKQMTKFVALVKDVPSIHAYVQSFKK
jgi:mono/diheme cytochrome c family protein